MKRSRIKQGRSLSLQWPEATDVRRPLGRGAPGDNEWYALRRRVFTRDGGCVAKALVPQVSCRGAEQAHHLWRKSQGGPDEEWNLKTLCAAHHHWVHNNVAEALALDLLRRRGQTEPG